MYTAEELERRANRHLFIYVVLVGGCLIADVALFIAEQRERKLQKKHDELKERAFHAPTEEERKKAGKELMEFIHKYGYRYNT